MYNFQRGNRIIFIKRLSDTSVEHNLSLKNNITSKRAITFTYQTRNITHNNQDYLTGVAESPVNEAVLSFGPFVHGRP